MKTAATNGRLDAGLPRNAWNRFWFQSTDPATLGFMRILTGLLVIYVHLAYCFDLQEFFGATGWWDLQSANAERTEYPIAVYDWSGKPPPATIATPQVPDRRVAVFDFLEHLPDDREQRDRALRFLNFILAPEYQQKKPLSETSYRQALAMLQKMGPLLPDDHAKMQAELRKEAYSPREHVLTLPDFFAQMSAAERVQTWNDALQLMQYLPVPETNFLYVLDWLQELSDSQRRDLAKFLKELPEGKGFHDRIDFVKTWNQDPQLVYAKGRYIFSLWFHLASPTAMWTFHFLFLAIFVLFTLGLWTRVTSVLTWLAVLCYIHRTNQVLFGMDTMMNILLFYLMIGPSGAALSVDRLVARYRAARALFRAGGQPVPWAEAVLAGPMPSALANFSIRLFQIHFCMMYAASGLAKLKGTMWWNTTAGWFTIANPEFCPVQYPFYESMLHQLASNRPLLAIVLAATTYFTLILEISLPFLIWTRLRPVLICGAVFLHTGIAWVMGLTCFGLLMMTLLLCFVPAATVRERIAWPTGSGPKLTLRYSVRDRRQGRLVALLRALDLTGQITLQAQAAKSPAEESPAQLIDADGLARSGYEILNHAMGTLVFGRSLAWLLWVPGVALVLRWFIGGHSETVDHIESKDKV